MAFFEKLRRAFGLDGSVDYDDEIDGIDATVKPLRQRQQQDGAPVARISDNHVDSEPKSAAVKPVHSADAGTPPREPARQDVDSTREKAEKQKKPVPRETVLPERNGREEVAVPAEIFRTVVAIFNRSLPEFLGSSVDTDRQEQYLYNALEKGMKSYLDSLENQSRRRYMELRQNDMLKVEQELQELRSSLARKEDELSEAKKLQLSAERQKRALAERLHDLEKQVGTLEAETEQLGLENKSMVNKLRVIEMQEKDNRESKAQEAELSADFEALKAENKALNEQIEQLRLKDTLGETMVNDLQSKASTALKTVQEKEEAMQALTADFRSQQNEWETESRQLKEALEAERHNCATTMQALDKANEQLVDLRAKVDEIGAAREEADTKVETLTAQLAKSREKLQIVSEIQVQVEELEEARIKSDAVLRRQKDEILEKDELLRSKDSDLRDKNMSLAQKDALIKRLEDQTDTLRRQLEDAAYERSQSESALRMEITRLKNLKPAPAPVAAAALVVPGPATADGAPSPAVAESAPAAADKTEAKAPRAARKAADATKVRSRKAPTHQNALDPDIISAPSTLVETPKRNSSFDDLLDDLPIIDNGQDKGAKKSAKDTPAKAEDVKPTSKPAPAKSAEAAKPITEPEPKPATNAPKPYKEEDIIEDLDTDWLVATPEPRKRNRAEESDDDFGYHEPPRNATPDNPAQMSLF